MLLRYFRKIDAYSGIRVFTAAVVVFAVIFSTGTGGWKEVILSFSTKDKSGFERFLTRKRPGSKRKDLEVFRDLFSYYTESKPLKNSLVGNQNYHAIRKTIAKEIVNFVGVTSSNPQENKVLLIKYFIKLKRFEIAWQLIEKEQKKNKQLNVDDLLELEKLKLSILPYYNLHQFKAVQENISLLQKASIRKMQLDMFFVQIQLDLRSKMQEGDVEFNSTDINKILNQYSEIEVLKFEPSVYLRIIEILRSEYLVMRNFKSFAKIAQLYYDKIYEFFSEKNIQPNTKAQLEYIMAHAYFRTTNFNKTLHHLKKLNNTIEEDVSLRKTYGARYISMLSSINVLKGNLDVSVSNLSDFLDKYKHQIELKDKLNLHLNLVAYLCCKEEFRKANKLLVVINQSDAFYQKRFGREWLIRKDLTKASIQLELGNGDIAYSILESIKKKHADMFTSKQYQMVAYYVELFMRYLNNPFEMDENSIAELEKQTHMQTERLLDDPKLLSFYVWLKAKITKKPLYKLLLEEFEKLS